MSTHLYDDRFYARRDRGSRTSAERICQAVCELVPMRSVVDIGCGVGTWLDVARDLGADRVLGIEGPWARDVEMLVPGDSVRLQDLSRPIETGERFDLAICLEVAEHLPASCADVLVASLVGLAPVVLFSAAIPYQGGQHHQNEQWPEYWAQRFQARGYAVIDAIRPRIWCSPDVRVWYAQNTLLYVDERRLEEWPKLAESAAQTDPTCLARVHPRLYERNSNPANLGARTLLRMLPSSLVRALRSRLGGGR